MTATLPEPSQRRKRHPAVTRPMRDEFLAALSVGWSVAHAAKEAGTSRQRMYELRAADDAFAAAWDDALASGTEALIDEVRRRATDGVEEPVFQGGKLVGHVRRYSDILLMFLVKQRDPSFRENHRVEVTGRDGGPVEVQAGYEPPTLADMVRLARDLGVLDGLGISSAAEVVDGEAVELPALPAGES